MATSLVANSALRSSFVPTSIEPRPETTLRTHRDIRLLFISDVPTSLMFDGPIGGAVSSSVQDDSMSAQFTQYDPQFTSAEDVGNNAAQQQEGQQQQWTWKCLQEAANPSNIIGGSGAASSAMDARFGSLRGGASDLDVSQRTDGHGGPLRQRFLYLLKQHTTLTHENVKNGFPSASEFYNPTTQLHFNIDDTATLLGDSPTIMSIWDNLIQSKKLAAVVTVISGSTPFAKQQLANLSALFARRPYSTVIRRVLVFDSTPDLMASVDKSIFKSVGISTAPLEDIARAVMLELACDVIHFFTHRIRSLTTNLSSEFVMTPMEYSTGVSSEAEAKRKIKNGDTSRGSINSIVVKDVPLRTIAGRAAKQRGDVLLQLGASSAALQAYGQVANVDNLWAAATIESLAAARYMESAPLLSQVAVFRQKFTDFRDADLRGAVDLGPVEDAVYHIKSRLEVVTASGCFGKTGVLPTTARQRITKEVEEPLQQAVKKWKAAIDAAKTLVEENKDDEDDAVNELLHQRLKESRSLFDVIVGYVYLELEFYLQEAYFLYPGTRSGSNPGAPAASPTPSFQGFMPSNNGVGNSVQRLSTGFGGSHQNFTPDLPNERSLVGFEIELLLKLASVRAEQKSSRSLLQCVGTISDACVDLSCIAPIKALAIQRRLPHLCYQCGSYRKAIFYAQQSASKDKAAGLHGHALSQLITACQWAHVPISIDEERGTLRLERDFSVSAANSARQTSPIAVKNESAGELVAAVGGASFASVRIQASLLLEVLGVLRQVQDRDEREWGVACHIAGLLLFKFSDYIGDVGQQKLRFILQSCSASLPSHIRPAIVSPEIIKSLKPLSLPPHLIPQKQHISGVKFIRTNTKMERLCFGGLLLSSPVLWVVGEVASVEITVTNPFLCALMITSLSLRCTLKPLPPNNYTLSTTGGGKINDAGTPLQLQVLHQGSIVASPYVTRGIILQQQSSEVVTSRILPERAGILVIEGVDVRIGQFEFKTPITVDVPHVEIPVMPRLPLVTCVLSENEAEIFLKQKHVFTVTIHNVGEVTVDSVRMSLHKSDCTISDCDGCCELPIALEDLISQQDKPATDAAPLTALEAKEFKIAQQKCQVARKNGDVMAHVDRTEERKIKQFQPGSQYVVSVSLYPPTHLKEPASTGEKGGGGKGGGCGSLLPPGAAAALGFSGAPRERSDTMSPADDQGPLLLKNGIVRDTVIVRIDYFQNFEAPAPPEDMSDMNTPTFAPIPRRIHETKLRVYLIPSVDVTGVTFSSDRRFLVAHMRNACQIFPIVVLQHEQVPFENQTSVLILPGQEVAVRLAICKIPSGLLGFPCVWHIQDRPDVNGILTLDLSKELEGLQRSEPLEDAILKLYGLQQQQPQASSSTSAASSQVNNTNYHSKPLPSHASPDLGELEEVLLWSSDQPQEQRGNQTGDGGIAAIEDSFILAKQRFDTKQTSFSTIPNKTPWSTRNTSFSTSNSPYAFNTDSGIDRGGHRGGCSNMHLTRFPLCEPVEVQLVVVAPWRTTMVVDLAVNVMGDPDAVVLAGPTSTTWALGGTGDYENAAELVLNFHVLVMTPGAHTIQLELKDKEERKICYYWGIQGEFADSVGMM